MDKHTLVQYNIFSAIKSNELSHYEKTQKNLKYILLSKRSQAGKAVYFQLYDILEKEKLQRQ